MKTSLKTPDKRLTLVQHLEELRRRLFWSAIALVVTTSISFIFTRQIFHFLLRPSGGIKPVFIEVTEMVGTYFRVAFLSGIALALPVIIYELVLFISPGLTPKERRFLFWLLPGAFLLFIAGALFSYFILLPPAMHVLLTFGSDIAEPQIRIGNYISVITRLMFWSGLIFEMPLV
ncbi:MAG: twin-arginine translocase subunit TatC, partial [Chloroflexota bacterium]